MNYIEITGGKERQRDYARSMVENCINKFMPRMNTLNIEVKLTKLFRMAILADVLVQSQ